MAERGTGKRASKGKQAGASGAPPEEQQQEPSQACAAEAPRERQKVEPSEARPAEAPGFTVRRRFDHAELHGTWDDLVQSVWARIESARDLEPTLKASLGTLFNTAAAYGSRTVKAERIPPAWRDILGGCFLVALEHVHELPQDLAGLSPEKQRALSVEVDQLNEAFATGDFSRLFQVDDDDERGEDLAAQAGSAGAEGLTGALVFYTVKSGPGAGQVRPAVIIDTDGETQTASVFVMYKSSDVPHEPPRDLDAVPRGARGELGTWCQAEGLEVADVTAQVLNSGLEPPAQLS